MGLQALIKKYHNIHNYLNNCHNVNDLHFLNQNNYMTMNCFFVKWLSNEKLLRLILPEINVGGPHHQKALIH